MKRTLIIAGFVALVAGVISCGPRRTPGAAYMPDMTYSKAYETYAPAQERLNNSGAEGPVHFSGTPVAGTVARGEMAAFPVKNDSAGYELSANVKNPLDVASVNMKESERLYLVNCGICHGGKLDGNGPLFNGGDGPFTAAPKNLLGDDMKALPEGKMFHAVTYGKGAMGSYASQLTSKQRWMVIAYVKAKQFPAGAAKPAGNDTTATRVDTTAVAKK